MKTVHVVSSNINSITYDPDTEELHVQFKGSGGTYKYSGVSAEKHEALMQADSIGSHFHKHIKSSHACEKLK